MIKNKQGIYQTFVVINALFYKQLSAIN